MLFKVIRIIINVKKLAKLLIILVCAKLQCLNVILCTYRKNLKFKSWSSLFWCTRYLLEIVRNSLSHICFKKQIHVGSGISSSSTFVILAIASQLKADALK